MDSYSSISSEIEQLTEKYAKLWSVLPAEVISKRVNKQQRTIKQIVGHLVDSATNNIHRVVHLQYQPSPLQYPDYAHFGNNDRWIAIQHYQDENWDILLQLWRYCNLHYAFIIRHINPEKLNNEWITALNENVALKDMVPDYLRHLKLHIGEIGELILL